MTDAYSKTSDRLRHRIYLAKTEELKQQRIKELEDYKVLNGRVNKREKTKAQRNYYYRRQLKKELEKENRDTNRMQWLIGQIEANGSAFDERLIEEAKNCLEK